MKAISAKNAWQADCFLNAAMSSLESIYRKMTPNNFSPSSFTHPPAVAPEQSRQISREVAHELNNVLTIVRGYADRLIFKHGDNPALRPELQLISDNARRAERVIRAASQPKPVMPPVADTVSTRG
jgi:hypothetical protein